MTSHICCCCGVHMVDNRNVPYSSKQCGTVWNRVVPSCLFPIHLDGARPPVLSTVTVACNRLLVTSAPPFTQPQAKPSIWRVTPGLLPPAQTCKATLKRVECVVPHVFTIAISYVSLGCFVMIPHVREEPKSEALVCITCRGHLIQNPILGTNRPQSCSLHIALTFGTGNKIHRH